MSLQRKLLAVGVILCVALIATALWFQHIEGIEPCPLCVFQRIFVIALGVLMLVGAIHDPAPRGRRIYGAAIAVIAGSGAAVAGRHVWLQSLPPDEVPECGPGFSYIFDAFPFQKAIEMVLRGSGECAEVQWTLFSISIPGWTLIAFIVLAIFGLWLCTTRSVVAYSSEI